MEDNSEKPFNLSLAVLKDIYTLLLQIQQISLYHGALNQQGLTLKRNYIRQLYIKARTILSQKTLDELSPPGGDFFRGVDISLSSSAKIPQALSKHIDRRMDEITIKIMDALKKEGFILPREKGEFR